MFVFVLLCITLCLLHSSFAIILKRKRKLVALLLLSHICIVTINVLSGEAWPGSNLRSLVHKASSLSTTPRRRRATARYISINLRPDHYDTDKFAIKVRYIINK